MHYGDLLRHRREELGASLEEAARWSALPRERYLELEETESPPVVDFERACRGLAIHPAELIAPGTTGARRTIARFRLAAPGAELRAEDLRILATAAQVGRSLGKLAAVVGRLNDVAQHRRVVGLEEGAPPWQQGYRLGEQARQDLTGTDDPIHDLEALFQRLGIHVVDVAFVTAQIEGASLWEPGALPVILVNGRAGRAGHPAARRAIMAHELCHLLHDGGEGEAAARVSFAEGLRTHHDAIEQRARAFAPAFLAPPRSLRRWARGLGGLPPADLVGALAEVWGLSFEGAAWHAKNTRLINASELDAVVRRPARPSKRAPKVDGAGLDGETGPILREALDVEPSLWMRGLATGLVARALHADLITAGRARELLEWT